MAFTPSTSTELITVNGITRTYPTLNLKRISQEICGIWTAIHLHPQVTVTEPIFTKLALVWQLFITNLYNEFPETLTNGVAADSRSQMDECGLHIRCSFLTL